VLTVKDIVVRSFDLDHLDLFWKVADTDEIIERYDFYILRSVDGSEGPYEQIAGPVNNANRFRDPEVNLLHKWRTYFYKIRVVNKDHAEDDHTYGPEWLRAKPDRIALEIQRRMYLVLKEKNGRPMLLFPAYTSGQRCPVCRDTGPMRNSIGRATQQNCETCYDMGYVGGFATPIVIYAQIDPSPVQPQHVDTAERADVTTSGRTGAYPPISPKDMVVDPENRRWQVEKAPSTTKLGAVVHQELVLREIPRPDVRYKVPVKLDLLQDFAPPKSFTRPMSLRI
jgi:hypothetical protein